MRAVCGKERPIRLQSSWWKSSRVSCSMTAAPKFRSLLKLHYRDDFLACRTAFPVLREAAVLSGRNG